ncbi:MAG: hypothetical protein L0216_17935 [Planctomycetales bacterium]|nr:hypothetical protein [Planctomycetales bacterium]
MPFREWHVDPISQSAWLETGQGPWAVSAKGVRSGPDVRVRVLGPDRRRVEPSVRTLLEAYPELEDDTLGEEPGSDAWRSRGLVTWGICPPIPEPLPPLPAPPPVPEAVPASDLPALSSLTPAQAAGVAAAAARALHSAFSDEVESLATWETLARDRQGAGDRDILQGAESLFGLSTRCFLDRVRLGVRVRELPRLAEAFHQGRVNYGKARAIARAALPADDALWTEIAVSCDQDTVEAFATAAGTRHGRRCSRGGRPKPVPRGKVPLRPLGGKVTVQVRLRLEGVDAARFREVRGFLDKLAGQPLPLAEVLVAIAGWYLRVVEKRKHHTVIYHRSPETQGARHPRDLMAQELVWAGKVPGARLRMAFGRLPEIPAEAPTEDRNWKITPGSRYVPVEIEEGVRWGDGERCVTPGCGNNRVVQHDHGHPIAEGGFADIQLDHRLCGPCNRAKHAGLLNLIYGPYGSVMVVDRLGRPFGSVTLGTEWDAAVRARIEAEVASELERCEHLHAYLSWSADPLAPFGAWRLAAEPELEELERLRDEPVAAGG